MTYLRCGHCRDSTRSTWCELPQFSTSPLYLNKANGTIKLPDIHSQLRPRDNGDSTLRAGEQIAPALTRGAFQRCKIAEKFAVNASSACNSSPLLHALIETILPVVLPQQLTLAPPPPSFATVSFEESIYLPGEGEEITPDLNLGPHPRVSFI